MSVKASICPTVTAFNIEEYRAQIERLRPFANRIHIDLMDGSFAPTKSPKIEEIYLLEDIKNDVHLMYKKPHEFLSQIIELKPHLLVVHYEADILHSQFIQQLHDAGIYAGLAVLQDTPIESLISVIDGYDHVLIFSGKLGHHGGKADLSLLTKVKVIKQAYPDVEVSWDGGISKENIDRLVSGGVDVLNVGSFIQRASNPKVAYGILESLVIKNKG